MKDVKYNTCRASIRPGAEDASSESQGHRQSVAENSEMTLLLAAIAAGHPLGLRAVCLIQLCHLFLLSLLSHPSYPTYRVLLSKHLHHPFFSSLSGPVLPCTKYPSIDKSFTTHTQEWHRRYSMKNLVPKNDSI